MKTRKIILFLLCLGVSLAPAIGDSSPGAACGLTLVKGDKPRPAAKLDQYGDPLTEGGVARLGTVRWRHSPGIFTLSLSANGKVMATGGYIGTGISIWDATSGKALHQLTDPPLCFSLTVSPDGKWIVMGNREQRVIDVATGKEVRRFDLPGREVVLFSPDGKVVAAGDFGKTRTSVIFYDFATGKELRRAEWKSTVPGVEFDLWPAWAFSPDSKTLAVGTPDGIVRFWDVATGKERQRFAEHKKRARAVAFAPDGKSLASVDEDGVILLWDLATGKVLQRMKAEAADLFTAAFSPNGAMLATAGIEGQICLWDPGTAKKIRQWTTPCCGQGMAFSPDGKILFTASEAGACICRWDTSTGKAIDLAGHTGRVQLLQFAGDGKTLVSFATDRKILEWDLATSRQRGVVFESPPRTSADSAVWQESAWSPGGKLLAWANYLENPAIHVWDVANGKERAVLKGHKGIVAKLRFSPNGSHLASAGRDGVRLWDTVEFKELQHLPSVELSPLAFSPDGKILAYAGQDRTIRLWELAAGKETQSWTAPAGELVFSGDGRQLAAGSGFNVDIWDVATGKSLMHREGQGNTMESLAYAPTGRILASAGSKSRLVLPREFSSTIFLWETYSGQLIRKIELPHNWTFEKGVPLAFSPDGRTLASGAGDSTITLWDMTHGATLAKPVTQVELDTLWADLTSDAAQADRAIWTLNTTPKQSMEMFAKQLASVPPADAKEVDKLIEALNGVDFKEREKARVKLGQLGEAAERQVRATIAKGLLPLFAKQRLERFLEGRDKDGLRKLRALECLEHIATPEARELLQEIVKESPNPRVVQAASGAIQRLAKRTP